MKYTPEELYDYCKDEGAEADLFCAVINNEIGFLLIPCKGYLSREKNNCYFISNELKDFGINKIYIPKKHTAGLPFNKPEILAYVIKEGKKLSVISLKNISGPFLASDLKLSGKLVEFTCMRFLIFSGVKTKREVDLLLRRGEIIFNEHIEDIKEFSDETAIELNKLFKRLNPQTKHIKKAKETASIKKLSAGTAFTLKRTSRRLEILVQEDDYDDWLMKDEDLKELSTKTTLELEILARRLETENKKTA